MICVGDYNSNQDSVYAKSAYIRPTSLSFIYKASPYSDDEYWASIYLVNITDGIESVIGKAEMKSGLAQTSYITQSLSIVYNSEYEQLPITHLRVIFKSGTKENKDHLEDNFRDASIWDGYSNAYIIGSQFWLDSFDLNYDK